VAAELTGTQHRSPLHFAIGLVRALSGALNQAPTMFRGAFELVL
jgi:hypothetical protein